MKIKGWEKYDDYVWRKKVGNGYKYIWIASNNVVRVVDFDSNPKPFAMDLTRQSYVLIKYRTLKEADAFVKKFMKNDVDEYEDKKRVILKKTKNYEVATTTDKNYSVWVGGSEVNNNYLTKKDAENLAKEFKDDGYEDVVVEKVR